MSVFYSIVVPAEAGIQLHFAVLCWTPSLVGVTREGDNGWSGGGRPLALKASPDGQCGHKPGIRSLVCRPSQWEGESLDVSVEQLTTRVLLRCKGPVAVAVKRPQNRPYAAPELLAVLKPEEEQEFAVTSLNDLLIEEVDQGIVFS